MSVKRGVCISETQNSRVPLSTLTYPKSFYHGYLFFFSSSLHKVASSRLVQAFVAQEVTEVITTKDDAGVSIFLCLDLSKQGFSRMV